MIGLEIRGYKLFETAIGRVTGCLVSVIVQK